MRLPEFTAELSLYRATNLYQMAGDISKTKGVLYPAQDLEMLNPIDSIAGEMPEISGDIIGDIAPVCLRRRICFPGICRIVYSDSPYGLGFLLCSPPVCGWVSICS